MQFDDAAMREGPTLCNDQSATRANHSVVPARQRQTTRRGLAIQSRRRTRPGYDGVVDSIATNPFVPEGLSPISWLTGCYSHAVRRQYGLTFEKWP